MSKSSKKRWRKALLIAVPVGVLLYTLGGFFGVPLVVQKFVVPKINESLNGTLSITKVRCNPFTLSITLEGVDVNDDQGRRVAGVGRFYGNLQASSLFREGFVFRKAEIDQPFAWVELREDGSINLAELVKPSQAPASTEPYTLPRLRGEGLAVREAEVKFTDRMVEPALERRITPVSFELSEFDTDPAHANEHTFAAKTDASELFDWEGQVELNPFTAVGWVTVKDLDLSKYQPYVGQVVPIRLTKGKLTVELSYVLAPAANTPVVKAKLKRLALSGLSATIADEPLLDLAALRVELADADAVKRDVTVKQVTVEGLTAYGSRDADGSLPILDAINELQRFSQESAAAATDATPTAQEPRAVDPSQLGLPQPYDKVVVESLEVVHDAQQAWTLSLESLAVSGSALSWRDAAMGEAVSLAIRDIALQAGPVRSSERFTTPLTLRCVMPEQGNVSLKGVVKPLDSGATLEPTLEQVALWPGSPYLPMVLQGASMPQGTLSLNGSVVAGWADLRKPVLTFDGDITLESLRVDLPEAGDRPLAAYDTLALQGLSLDTTQRRVDLQELNIIKPVGTLPLGMFTQPPGDQPSDQTDAPADLPAPADNATVATDDSPFNPFAYDTTVGSIRIEEGDLRVLDPSVDPQGKVGIASLNVSMDDLHLPPHGAVGTPATLALSGRLQDAAPLTVTGKVAPSLLDPTASYADLQIKLDTLPLPPFSGYSAAVVGRLIASGQLATEFPFTLENKQIDAKVPVTIAQFKLGESVEREGALSLPLDLAVAVLTGLDGTIKPPALPIRGDLTDPSVSVVGVVIHAITNVVVGVAAAPFKMLTGLFPQGEEVDPSTFAFTPGSAQLPDDADRKLTALSAMLSERPMLGLKLIPVPDETADTDALRKQTFIEQYLGLLNDDDPRKQDPALLAVGSAAYQQAILETYQVTHPDAVFDEATLPVPDVQSNAGEGDPSERFRRRIRGGSATVVRLPAPGTTPAPGAAPGTESNATSTPVAPGSTDEAPITPAGEDAESTNAPDGDAPATGGTAEPAGPPMVTFEQAEQAVLADVTLPPDALAGLSRRRAEAIRDALAQQHNTDVARLQIADADLAPAPGSAPGSAPGQAADGVVVSDEAVGAEGHSTAPAVAPPAVRVEVTTAP